MEYSLLKNSVQARCSVLTKENTFLFLGRIADYNDAVRTISLENCRNEEISSYQVPMGMDLKLLIRPNSKTKQLIVVEGTVLDVTRTKVFLRVWGASSKEEGRAYFRQNVMQKGKVLVSKEEDREDPCIIVDISIGGIAIQSQESYEIGDRLSFRGQRLRPEGYTHTFSCIVMRKDLAKTGEGWVYGCRFEELSVEEDRLCQDILSLQAMELQSEQSKRPSCPLGMRYVTPKR